MSRETMMRKHGLSATDFQPKPKQPEIVNISREEFNLLDALTDNTIYYVSETNGTITMIKGENK